MQLILNKFFHPSCIALVGATEKPDKIGFAVMQNLVAFQGSVFPVNPKYEQVLGKKCYPRLRDLPQVPDLAVFVTPPASLPGLMEECGKAGIKAALVLTSGFREVGEEGERHYRNLRQMAAKNGVHLIGPNSLGLMTPSLKLNVSYAPALPAAGRLVFISQSGSMGSAILDWAADKRLGFSYFVSLGNMADVGFSHLIDYFGADSRTGCILIYMESLRDARKFLSAARAFARSKPIVVLKAASTREGARIARTHTSMASTNDAAYDAAFRRAGIIRVQTIQQLFDCAQTLANQPLPPGKRLAIVTNSGAPAILATDSLVQRGGQLAQLKPESIAAIAGKIPQAWSHTNPIDLLGIANAEHFREAVHGALFDPGVDAVLVILTAQSVTDPVAVAQAIAKESKAVFSKPVYACWMGMQTVREGREVLEANKIPWYPFPERAIVSFMHMVNYRENLDLLYETTPDQPINFSDIQRDKARKFVADAQKKGRTHLNAGHSKELLAFYGIPVNRGKLAKSEDEAVACARELGFPVAVKIESPDIWSKSDVHGVRLGIETEDGVRQVYKFLMENVRKKRPDARLEGVSVERMFGTGTRDNTHELMLGAQKDPVFGPVILFGLGGPAAEIWEDRTVGLPPLNLALAKHVVEATRVAQLLRGYRNQPGIAEGEIETIICRFAYLLMDIPEIRSIEINPLAANSSGCLVLDASITLEDTPGIQREPYAHLSITPYPTQWIREVKLKNGQIITLRPIRPEDEPLEVELTKRTSKESLYFRFFGYVPGLDHKMMARFTHIDYDREMAIVAIADENGKPAILGVVRIVGDGWRETAEYAILVADAWHGKGLGGLLTDYIIEIAKAQGYKSINATFLKTNGAMRRLFERKKFKISAGLDEADKAELVLSS